MGCRTPALRPFPYGDIDVVTMKDWLVVLNEWEWRNHPEIPITPGARAAYTAAELVEDTGARSRRIASAVKSRARRLLNRAER